MTEQPTGSTPGAFRISQLWRYPVKGLSGQALAIAHLSASAHFPGDRNYAIGGGNERVDDGIWLKKAFFLQLMSHEALANIDCDFEMDQECEKIILSRNGELLLTADMKSDAGRSAVAAFFDELLQGQLPGPAKMVCLDNGAFTDTKAPLISLGGSASITDFAGLTGTTPDSRRFRLNIIFNTTTPFEELALVGKTLAVGDVRLDVTEPVSRCAAIDVNPETAERGDHYLHLMENALGHTYFGIFARVTQGGTVRLGDKFSILTY